MNHIKGLCTLLSSLDAEALLLTSEISQRYATGFPFSDGFVVITEGESWLVTDFRYQEEATRRCRDAFTVVAPPSQSEFLRELFSEKGISRVGLEDKTLSHANYQTLTDLLGITPIPIGEGIEALRAVKDSGEIAAVRRAQALTDAAFSHILSALTPKMTEVEVALELEFFMRRAGADGIAFPTIAVSGTSSSLPHGVPARTPLSRGFLTMDFGAVVDGYASDMTRTVVLGKATAEMKRLYATVLEAQRRGMEAIAAGVDATLVDGAARSHIDAEGYRGLFGHSFGHGVGLEVHEAPRLSSRVRSPLVAGNVVTAEPGIYQPGIGGCRIENMGVVTENGFDVFTASTTELIELF
ncbi:MAG: aminopeptidase P family protein [Clostridia bacterium]|nr:aminopeptidase P family protein [Clostridia bacterium]